MDIVCHSFRRKYILNSMTLEMSLLLATILLAISITKALPTKDPENMYDFGSGLKIAQPKELDSKAPHGKLTTKQLYENMMQAENELGHGDDENDYEDEKYSEGASLLSTMPSSGHKTHFKCMSCSGLLPLSWDDEQDDPVNEQLYCFPDGAPMPQLDETRNNENDELDSVCFGAIRCWKAKVREYDGRVRISRGCVGSGKEPNQKQLDFCMGSVSVVSSNNETNKNDSQLPLTVWTSSHTYSSATFGVQQQSQPSLPASYAFECCAGQDRCNDGPFPLLPKLALTGWRWTPVSKKVVLLAVFFMAVATIAALVFFRKAGQMKRTKHRQRSKGGLRKNKRRKRNDRDRKRNRHLSFSSMSTSSSTSSISSGGQSSSGEGKRSRSRSRRKRHTTTLTMVDLLEGVVVANESGTDIDDSPQPSSFRSVTSGYSPAAITESTIDGDFLPPPYNSHQQEDDWTSGSGYGLPVLVQRTLAKQIQLQQLVGKGRYGEVWRATYWNGGHEHVAVKIFLSKDEPSWKRETEIYSTVLMRHDNILGFIGSDIMTSRNSYTTQLLLITHYHRYGSLYDFLQTPMASDPTCTSYDFGTINDTTVEQSQQTDRDRPPLTMNQMLNVLYTVASGLCHLHTEIFGTQGKPGIAHRDIKSKNVLVKCARTGACCVADFGMAVTSLDAGLPIQTTTAAVGDNSQNTRVGTKRYMAPEVLDDSISSAAALALASTIVTEKAGMSSSSETTSSVYWCFDAYRRGDVYSYALVMWEVLSRTLISYGPVVAGQDLKVDKEKQIQFSSVTENCYNPYVYRAPYQDRGAGWDPGFDDMRHIVCSPDPVLSRPGVASEWLADPIMNAVVETMRECWHGNPNARLPSLRVKKKLFKLIHELAEREQQYSSEPEQPISVTE